MVAATGAVKSVSVVATGAAEVVSTLGLSVKFNVEQCAVEVHENVCVASPMKVKHIEMVPIEYHMPLNEVSGMEVVLTEWVQDEAVALVPVSVPIADYVVVADVVQSGTDQMAVGISDQVPDSMNVSAVVCGGLLLWA